MKALSDMKFVVVGNGIAGVSAAQVIAQESQRAEIAIYTQEPYHYYPRPKLWEFLAGETKIEELFFYPPSWYEERGIKVHLKSRVRGLDVAGKRLALADGREIAYDRLLLANGSVPSVPPVEGVDKEGVFTLRSLDDALAIKEYAGKVSKAVVIGGGLLGLETARALSLSGLEVTVLEFFPWLLPRQLDPEGAKVLTSKIEAMGLRVMTGANTEVILGAERAAGVLLKDGREVKGELILFSAGIVPSIKLAQGAGLVVNKGIVVDDYLRTSAPDIYAAGDVAEHRGKIYGIIPASREQASVAARNMLGQDSKYEGTIPSNTLKIVGIDLTAIGLINPEGEGYQVLRKETPEVYKKFVLQDGQLVGAILLGDRESVAPVSRLIRSQVNISAHAEKLLDEDFDLKSLPKEN